MNQIIFATSNNQKLLTAQKVCNDFGIELIQEPSLHVDEIQGEEGEAIARHKANEVYKLLQKPCVITDDTWMIPALKGFPGPYMKSVNEWFTSEDWLRLMNGVKDRRIILRQIAVYQDENGQHLFAVDVSGVVLEEVRGDSKAFQNQNVISLEEDGRSITEIFNTGRSALEGHHTTWHELGAWLAAQQ